MESKSFLNIRIDENTKRKLEELAKDGYDGNISLTMRQLIREEYDRRNPGKNPIMKINQPEAA